MKRILMKFIFLLLFLSGLSLLLYPLVSNEWNNYRQNKLISNYEEVVAEQVASGGVDYTQAWVQAEDYNAALQPYVLPDSFAIAANQEEPEEAYMACLNLTGDGMMGYVQIPKINVKIPIFHTTTEEVLQVAAGHLEGSSLPVGGEGSHTVISAHRGLPSAALFTDLDQLEEGDIFLLYILDDVLCYQVDQISVVEPTDTSLLSVEEGEDLATLMTCTPYGVNSHRMLVRGKRVDYVEIEEAVVAASAYSGPSLHTNYVLWVVVGLSVTWFFIVLLYFYDRNKKRKAVLSADGSSLKAIAQDDMIVDLDLEPDTPETRMDDGRPESDPEGWRNDWPEGDPEGWRDDWPEDDPEGWRDDWSEDDPEGWWQDWWEDNT